jgi:hypothetical protein
VFCFGLCGENGVDCVQKLRFFVHDGRELAERVGSCMHEGRVSAEKVGSCIHEGVFFAEWMGSCMHEGGVFTERVGSCMHERAAVFPGRVPEVRGVMGLAFSTLPGAVWMRFVDWELRACMILWWWGFGRMRAGVLASVLMGRAGGFCPQISRIFAVCFQGVGWGSGDLRWERVRIVGICANRRNLRTLIAVRGWVESLRVWRKNRN